MRKAEWSVVLWDDSKAAMLVALLDATMVAQWAAEWAALRVAQLEPMSAEPKAAELAVRLVVQWASTMVD